MLKQTHWSLNRTYRTGTENEPLEFYMNALSNSVQLKLLLGYFSSSAINLLSIGFAKFLYKGGTMEIVINNVLSKRDKAAIEKGLRQNNSKLFDITNLKELKESLDEYGTHFFECIAWLVSEKRIEFKIIKPKDKKGISHYKSGIFYDKEDKVSFKGSVNFTASGLLENLEELDINLSWESERANNSITNQEEYFNSIFEEKADFVNYVIIEDVELAIQKEFGNKNINELLIEENFLIEKKKELFQSNKGLKKIFIELQNEIQYILNEPKFPFPSGARKYQKEAYNNWVKNNYQGIFAMATGTGKTITSLNCVLEEYKKTKTYQIVILVPTITLVEQWKKECIKFNYKNIITVSSKEKWNDSIAFFNTASKLTQTSFVIISTYASFIRPKFQLHFKSLPDSTILIADEVHNMGAPSIAKIDIKLSKRVGLSATPERKYDTEGNISVNRLFNDKSPYTFSFKMKEALEMRPPALCGYKYYPHIVFLTSEELEKYASLSKRLMRYFDSDTKKYKDSPEVTKLLLLRKQIIHKAVNKKSIFKEIIKKEFALRGNLKYTLVYVPEGNEIDYSNSDEYSESSEDQNLITEYSKIVKDVDNSVFIRQYTANTQNRDKVIKQFEIGEIHTLTSMKCLDEGVDVPRSELAIFCSSTGNPRQFIQRRGRILRTHKDKTLSVIHDLVVVPAISDNERYFEMERNMLKKELERVIDFSELSINKMDTYLILKDILEHYSISLNE